MDGHIPILRLLPADPQQEVDKAGQLEAVHLLHVVFHWLLIIIVVAIGIWLALLTLALVAWVFWAMNWLARRCISGWRARRSGEPI